MNHRNPSARLADIFRAMASDNPYLRDAVLTATPEQLQLMLYDGAIRFASQAKDALLKKDYEASCEKLIRAQNIILEMQSGLNPEVNPELCDRVAALYNFIFRKLVDANVQRDTQAIDDAVKVLRLERETWQILVDKVTRERQAMATGQAASAVGAEPVSAGSSQNKAGSFIPSDRPTISVES